jgi:hypothetical protein
LGFDETEWLRSDKLDARPAEYDLPPCSLASFEFRCSALEQFCRFFEMLRPNEDEALALFMMVVLIVSEEK